MADPRGHAGSRGQHQGGEAALGGAVAGGRPRRAASEGSGGGCGCSGRSEGARPRREQRGGEALMGGGYHGGEAALGAAEGRGRVVGRTLQGMATVAVVASIAGECGAGQRRGRRGRPWRGGVAIAGGGWGRSSRRRAHVAAGRALETRGPPGCAFHVALNGCAQLNWRSILTAIIFNFF